MKNMKHVIAGFVIGVVMAMAPSCGSTKACSSTTCSTGCCDAKGVCQAGSSNGACGQLGGTCQVCQIAQACSLGTCSQTNGNGGGSSNGGGSGGGSFTGGGTGGGVTGGGNTGGGGGTCDGCIFQGGCINRANSNNNTLCGQGGVACATCSGTQSCQNFVCTTGGTGGGSTTGGGGGTTGGGGGTSLQPIGGACASSTNCQAGLTCRMTTQRGDATYPGGYCSKACTTSTDCGGTNACLGGAQSSLQFYGEPNGFCAAGCASAGSQSSCRQGYACEFAATGSPGNCWLTPTPAFNGGTPATNTGIACTSDTCQPSGTNSLLSFCFKATQPDGGFSGWTQGYCSADCGFDNTGTFCGSNATCVTLGTPPNDNDVCLARCSAPGTRSTCRAGYSCYGLRNPDGGTPVNSICYPDCTIVACQTGTTCNTTSGQCQ